MPELAHKELTLPSDSALQQLQTEQAALLDCIDKLRSTGAAEHVDLPQLVVCGDQSSGKSSVLQAISRVKFPIKGTLCTRFATELALRRAVHEKISVSIRPGGGLSEEETSRLKSFHGQFSGLSEFASLVENARKFMGLADDGGPQSFSKNVLRVEIQGPSQPHLTIVDLPGLIKSADLPEHQKGILDVYKLVESYIENPKSIILAVLSGNNDSANQAVRELVFKHDRDGLRTLGIITKPDLLRENPDQETEFIQLAKNEKTHLKLGWHVVRNRKATESDTSDEARDEEERKFFSEGIWNTLPRSDIGINALRTRLSKILSIQISQNLPNLQTKMREGVKECNVKLNKLGKPRDTPSEQRIYLSDISRNFSDRTYAAINGDYRGRNGFFDGVISEKFMAKRLRATIHKLNEGFAHSMRKEGHRWNILSNGSNAESRKDKNVHNLFSNYRPGNQNTEPISRSDLVAQLAEHTKWDRGKELPGFPSPYLIGTLFQEQSKPWEYLASNHVDSVSRAVERFIPLAFEDVTDKTTSAKIYRKYIAKKLTEKRESAQKMLEEVLKIHKRGHLITYNPAFEKRKEQFNPNNIVNSQQASTAPNMPNKPSTLSEGQRLHSACSDIIDTMEEYYKITLEVFIANVTTLVIENCLIDELPNMFSERVVAGLDDKELRFLAAESDGIKAERKWQEDKRDALKAGLEVCNEYRLLGPTFTESVDVPNSPMDGNISDSQAPSTPTPSTREKSPEDTTVNGITLQGTYTNHEQNSPGSRSASPSERSDIATATSTPLSSYTESNGLGAPHLNLPSKLSWENRNLRPE